MKNSRTIRNIARVLCVAVGCSAIAPSLVACCNDEENVKALVLASDVLDTVFNPYFYTSGNDGEIVGQTQIGMMSSDNNGQPLANWNEPCVAFDYSIVKTGTSADFIPPNNYSNWYTDYYFALKDNIKFSDGVTLTEHDVLFNMYMYLDPAYTGSSTMYSTKIDGLTEYRTQTDASNADDADMEFNNEVESRFLAIESWASRDNTTWDDLSKFEVYRDQATGETKEEDKVIESDINKIQEYYKDYLNDMWLAAVGANIEEEYVHKRYFDINGDPIFKEAWQLFLYNTGILTLEEHRDQEGKIDYSTPHNAYNGKDHSQKALVEYVYNGKFADQKDATKTYKTNLLQTMYSYSVYVPMNEYLLSAVKYRKFQGNMQVKKIRGIEILTNQTSIKTQNESTKEVTNKTLKDADGNEKAYSVLHIRIHGVDPKAIQNFSFTVAPGHYYSTKELWDKALKDESYAENFGVSFSDPNFMNTVRVKQLPMGAGPYMAAKAEGGKATSKGQFSRNNMVYLESNKYFMLGEPKIKRLRYKVISSKDLYTTITETNEVHYASPSMKQEEVTQLAGNTSVHSVPTDNLGYGYIGISATYIPNIYIRKAIMASFDPDLITSYYGSGASVITRSMSKTLAYYYYDNYDEATGQGTDPAPYYANRNITIEERTAIVKSYLEQGGCTKISNGIRYDETGRNPLKYTFTIAGDNQDHPALQILNTSARILNSLGCDITVKNDSMALSKLSSGLLTVWAAAWSSSSDPDMYQVYHKDSQATSTTAWGFKHINSSKFTEPKYPSTSKQYNQQTLLSNLATEIELGRESDVPSERKPHYTNALDILMDLAVEFPTYQRKQYYVWKANVFKEETLHLDEVGTYRSPLSRIWEVEMK